jgi:hypothetical protein
LQVIKIACTDEEKELILKALDTRQRTEIMMQAIAAGEVKLERRAGGE